jgi:hypothetical protein
MIKMSSHSSSASVSTWVVSTMVRPRFASSRRRFMTERFRIGSMPVENSSRKTIGVSTMNTFAT